MKKIVILGTLDTKGQQIAYLKEKIEARGQKAVIMDLSMGGEPPFKADITPSELLACSGSGSNVPAFLKKKGIAELKKVMAIGAGNKVMELLSKGEIDGIVALGGLSMAMLAAHVMQKLPFGIPKVIGTTAFTDKPVSMKYRGLFDVHSRGEGRINYVGQAGRWSLEEGYQWWKTNHSTK